MATTDKFKLDIFSILGKLNSGDLNVWDSLSEEERKGFSPYIITRWMSGTNDPSQIMLLNELVNINLFGPLNKKPEIMCKLLACCGTGQPNKRFFWIAESKKQKTTGSTILEVVKEYFDCTTKEAKYHMTFLEDDDIIDMATNLGYQADEIKSLKKELSK